MPAATGMNDGPGYVANLKAPFPWFGGKSRVADAVWQAFGTVDRYLEPFAGTLAVLLGNPHPPRSEVVCDTNGLLCNFWRSIKWNPEEAARWACWPSMHDDLTARNNYLFSWAREHAHLLSEDPEYYDPKAAGWWVWGVSNWIGSGYGDVISQRKTAIPSLNSDVVVGGRGVMRASFRKIPEVGSRRGVNKIPTMRRSGVGAGGLAPDYENTRERLRHWFLHLQNRLFRVVVLNRDWRSCTSPTMLGEHDERPGLIRGIFLDPPYIMDGVRDAGVYASDADKTSDSTARAALEWALTLADRPGFKVAYCCYGFEFEDDLKDWSHVDGKLTGVRTDKGHLRKERIYFSPQCRQRTLF